MLPFAALQAQQDQVNVLYITRNEPADGGDAIVVAILDSLGYNVITLIGSAYNEFSHTDFSTDVVFFGEAINFSSVTPFKNAGFPVPCVSFEGFCVRENRWALTTNDQFGQILGAASLPPVVSDPTKHFAIKVTADHPAAVHRTATCY
ncbi:MAG: hypothetical protein OHK0039_07260 [Bacteroidia bacterium]